MMRAIDLFAGAGGLSEGAKQADCDVLWSANHWEAACDIYRRNHPATVVSCQDLQQADFRTAPAHDILLAAPACQGHSPARGKERPHHDAQRSTAWAVVSAAECHRPAVVLVENVPEYSRWLLYPAWCAAMHALGYALAPMILDAADHGVPQHRRRLFIVGTRSKHPIELQLPQRAHVGASEIVDFTAGRWTPVERTGRAQATLERIRVARERFGRQFVMPYYGSGSGLTGRCLSRPLGTITTLARWAVVDGDRMRMLTTSENRAAMGFPDTYQLPQAQREALHMLGNAVVPPVARDVINAIREAA